MNIKPTHRLKIGISNGNNGDGEIVRCRRISLRERILHWFLGDIRRVTIIVPSDNVHDITIQEAMCDGTESG